MVEVDTETNRAENLLMEDYDPACEVSLPEFDILCDTEEWSFGPRIETGDAAGYRDVLYMPNKRADGILKNGRYVWCWATGTKVKTDKMVDKATVTE